MSGLQVSWGPSTGGLPGLSKKDYSSYGLVMPWELPGGAENNAGQSIFFAPSLLASFQSNYLTDLLSCANCFFATFLQLHCVSIPQQ